jgi:hypothetical protein
MMSVSRGNYLFIKNVFTSGINNKHDYLNGEIDFSLGSVPALDRGSLDIRVVSQEQIVQKWVYNFPNRSDLKETELFDLFKLFME